MLCIRVSASSHNLLINDRDTADEFDRNFDISLVEIFIEAYWLFCNSSDARYDNGEDKCLSNERDVCLLGWLIQIIGTQWLNEEGPCQMIENLTRVTLQ